MAKCIEPIICFKFLSNVPVLMTSNNNWLCHFWKWNFVINNNASIRNSNNPLIFPFFFFLFRRIGRDWFEYLIIKNSQNTMGESVDYEIWEVMKFSFLNKCFFLVMQSHSWLNHKTSRIFKELYWLSFLKNEFIKWKKKKKIIKLWKNNQQTTTTIASSNNNFINFLLWIPIMRRPLFQWIIFQWSNEEKKQRIRAIIFHLFCSFNRENLLPTKPFSFFLCVRILRGINTVQSSKWI